MARFTSMPSPNLVAKCGSGACSYPRLRFSLHGFGYRSNCAHGWLSTVCWTSSTPALYALGCRWVILSVTELTSTASRWTMTHSDDGMVLGKRRDVLRSSSRSDLLSHFTPSVHVCSPHLLTLPFGLGPFRREINTKSPGFGVSGFGVLGC